MTAGIMRMAAPNTMEAPPTSIVQNLCLVGAMPVSCSEKTNRDFSKSVFHRRAGRGGTIAGSVHSGEAGAINQC